MRAQVYAAYLQSSVAGYAQDNVAAGRWPAQGALERSQAEFDGQMPLGLATPDNHLFEIVASDAGPTVGFLWLAMQERNGVHSAFVYDLEVKAEFRRQGHARRAFEALETVVNSLGLSSIGLHVFAHNAGGQALYRGLGYAATGINMLKRLEQKPAQAALEQGAAGKRVPDAQGQASPAMRFAGSRLDASQQCEEVLRTLPMWFGIEESLRMYVRDSVRLPGFAVYVGDAMLGFISLKQHFAQAWEVHCVAVRAESRNRGYGKALMAHAERWLAAQDVRLLQVKTVAATSPSPHYAQTRVFYERLGYLPLEVFPELWSPRNPCLQLVKFLERE